MKYDPDSLACKLYILQYQTKNFYVLYSSITCMTNSDTESTKDSQELEKIEDGCYKIEISKQNLVNAYESTQP